METVPSISSPSLQQIIQRFASSACSWLSTVRPGGRAHCTPVWHVWHGTYIYVITRANAVKAVNIQANPHVAITHPDPVNPIIVEGVALFNATMRGQLQPLFKDKYDWDIATDGEYDTVIEIEPRKLMTWGENGEGRWHGPQIAAIAGQYPGSGQGPTEVVRES